MNRRTFFLSAATALGATQVQGKRGVSTWHYSLDFNERCPGA